MKRTKYSSPLREEQARAGLRMLRRPSSTRPSRLRRQRSDPSDMLQLPSIGSGSSTTTQARGSPPLIHRRHIRDVGDTLSPRVEEQYDLVKLRGLAKQLALPVRLVLSEIDLVTSSLEEKLEREGVLH